MNIYILRAILYYLSTGAMISGLAFLSHYPLVYADSGAYIQNAFELVQFDDRPLAYGLIIRALSWKSTMWTVVIFQGAVASWLLMLLVREVVPAEPLRRLRVHLCLIVALVLFSSLPWYSAQLMADHFTPLVLIIAFLLFRGKDLGPWRHGTLWILLFFFTATHNAHLPMAMVLSLGILVSALRNGGRWRQPVFRMCWLGFNAVILGTALMTMAFNHAAHGRFQLSRASNVFLAGRLCEGGIMADYLDETCAATYGPLCAIKDDLPRDAGGMLWSDKGISNLHVRTIGDADSLLAPTVSDLLSRPAYLARFIRSAVVSTAVQLFQYDAGSGLEWYGEGSSPYFNVSRLPDEMGSYRTSRQEWGYWRSNGEVNRVLGIVLVLAMLVIAIAWTDASKVSPTLWKLMRWAFAWIFLNAAMTSTFSVIDPRLQSRVMWLIPMLAVFVLVQQHSIRAFFALGPGAGETRPNTGA